MHAAPNNIRLHCSLLENALSLSRVFVRAGARYRRIRVMTATAALPIGLLAKTLCFIRRTGMLGHESFAFLECSAS